MRIYFEDGQLHRPNGREFKYSYLVDAGHGYSKNRMLLDHIKQTDNNASVYTNSVIALDNYYAWNNEIKVPEIYIANKDGVFTRIDELTVKCLREAHNIMKMYIAGAFINE